MVLSHRLLNASASCRSSKITTIPCHFNSCTRILERVRKFLPLEIPWVEIISRNKGYWCVAFPAKRKLRQFSSRRKEPKNAMLADQQSAQVFDRGCEVCRDNATCLVVFWQDKCRSRYLAKFRYYPRLCRFYRIRPIGKRISLIESRMAVNSICFWLSTTSKHSVELPRWRSLVPSVVGLSTSQPLDHPACGDAVLEKS